ncbi:ImmA/IrrE family metallo-endopeptidase [Nocardia vinacea]|uniref:ImmA/IrrE family metallo-endopeptidase n=1 Tax=Nocardia vinacea TaxID=96468 RepID=UPI0005943F08|nr:ImmA/IrrE family metallo-endopeptidase [Nocardia vinacea]
MTPRQPVKFSRSLQLAREQADLLIEHAQRSNSGILMAITRMHKVRIDYVVGQRLRGASFWDTRAKQWVIQVNWDDHWKSQLFAVAHEFKYILDYTHTDVLYQGSHTMSATCEASCAAYYFARYLLMPDDQLIEAVNSGVTDTADLADRFGVTEDIAQERLNDLRLRVHPKPGLRLLMADRSPA